MHDTGRVGQGGSASPQEDGTGAGWAQTWPSAANIHLLQPMLSSCKLGERRWSQVQGGCCGPWIQPCRFHSNQRHLAWPWYMQDLSGGFLRKCVLTA